METPQNEQQTAETTPIQKKQRTRIGRKRSDFTRAPKPAWPVRGLWENAPQEEKVRAHETCMKMLEYWLGKKDKVQVAKEMSITTLRVWQLSQQALSGMMAGLLTQPRRRVGPEAYERSTGLSVMALRKRITELEKELSRTEDLVRVLRTAPWLNPVSESPMKGGSKRVRKPKRKSKASNQRTPTTSRESAPEKTALEEGGFGAG